MIDLVLKWSVDGQQNAVRSAKEVSAEVNKSFGDRQQQRQVEWSRRQAQLARESRKESFAKLSIEEKLLRLSERRAQTERFLAKAEAQGNAYRANALRVRLGQVNAALPRFSDANAKEQQAKQVLLLRQQDKAAKADDEAKAKRQEDAAKKISALAQQQSVIARKARQDAFARLSVEERFVRLQEQRLRLERFIARAEAQGNTYRAQALRLRLAQVGAAMPGLQSPGFFGALRSGFGSMASGSMWGGAAAGGFGGAAIGGAIGSVLGMAAMAVVSSFKDVALSGVRLAENLGDMAEQLGTTREELLRIRQAGAAANVPQRVISRSLSRVGQLRAAALGGDQEAAALLANYGVSGEMLGGSSSNLDIAMAVRRSLGAGGMRPTDAKNLAAIFGEQPQRMLAALGKVGAPEPGMEGAIRNLDITGSALEMADLERERQSLKAGGASGVSGFIAEQAKADSVILYLIRFFRNRKKLVQEASQGEALGATPGDVRTAGEFALGNKTEEKSSTLSHFAGRSAADALTRIGLFLGGNTATIVRLDRQITELRRIVRELGLLNRNVQDDA